MTLFSARQGAEEVGGITLLGKRRSHETAEIENKSKGEIWFDYIQMKCLYPRVRGREQSRREAVDQKQDQGLEKNET